MSQESLSAILRVRLLQVQIEVSYTRHLLSTVDAKDTKVRQTRARVQGAKHQSLCISCFFPLFSPIFVLRSLIVLDALKCRIPNSAIHPLYRKYYRNYRTVYSLFYTIFLFLRDPPYFRWRTIWKRREVCTIFRRKFYACKGVQMWLDFVCETEPRFWLKCRFSNSKRFSGVSTTRKRWENWAADSWTTIKIARNPFLVAGNRRSPLQDQFSN